MTTDITSSDNTHRPRLAIQLYSVREIDEPLDDLLQRVGTTAFEGVEFAHRLPEASATDVARTLKETGLAVAGAHVGFSRLDEDLPTLTERYETIGSRRAIVPHIEPEQFADREGVEELAEQLDETGKQVSAAGLSLCYHNQDHDFVDVDGVSAYERLLDLTDSAHVAFELDVGGAVAAGYDPTELLERHGDRIPLVHIKDVHAPEPEPGAGQRCTPIGEGDVDIPAVVRAARDAGVDWLVFENDEPADPVAALQRGAEVLEEALGDGKQ